MTLSIHDKAVRAKGLLQDEVLVEAFRNVSQQAWDDFTQSAPDDIEKRNQAYYRHRAIEELKDALKAFETEELMAQRRK